VRSCDATRALTQDVVDVARRSYDGRSTRPVVMPGRSDGAARCLPVVGLGRRGRGRVDVKMLSTVVVLGLAVVMLHSTSALSTDSHHINVIQHDDADWQRRTESLAPGLQLRYAIPR